MSETGLENSGSAGLSAYVLRFALVFGAFSVVALVVTTYFEISGNMGLSVGILMASAVAAGQKFITDQKRVFEGGEKFRMALFSMLVALVLSALLVLGLVLASGDSPQELVGELLHIMPASLFAAALFFAIAFNFGMLYLSYSFLIGKIYQGMVKRGEV